MLGRLGRTAEPAAQGERSRRPPLLAGSYFAGARILRVVPPGIRHAAAAPGGAAWYWLSLAQRRAALDNYAAALGLERSDPQVARVARRAFQNYGPILIDFVLMGSLSPEELIERRTLDGRDRLGATVARGLRGSSAVPHLVDTPFTSIARWIFTKAKPKNRSCSAWSIVSKTSSKSGPTSGTHSARCSGPRSEWMALACVQGGAVPGRAVAAALGVRARGLRGSVRVVVLAFGPATPGVQPQGRLPTAHTRR